MKKTLTKIIFGVVLIIIVVTVCFLMHPDNKQDLTFLNYENLVSVAAQSNTLSASLSENDESYIIDGLQLAQFLDKANWTAQKGFTRGIQQETDKNSKASIQIKIDGIYLKIFDTDTANIYDETVGKDRYYRMSDGDYEKILAMLTPNTD